MRTPPYRRRVCIFDTRSVSDDDRPSFAGTKAYPLNIELVRMNYYQHRLFKAGCGVQIALGAEVQERIAATLAKYDLPIVAQEKITGVNSAARIIAAVDRGTSKCGAMTCRFDDTFQGDPRIATPQILVYALTST